MFLNVLLTLELLHFDLKVGRDYQDRMLEENVGITMFVLYPRAIIIYMNMH